MFLTFYERFQQIETQYNTKNYNIVVVECAKLVEQAIGYIFNNFHTTLKSTETMLKFLEFEKRSGEKYSAFVKKPTIGVGIGYYNTLADEFPNHPWINTKFKTYLNTINTIRNTSVHSGKDSISDHDAGFMIDNTERFLKESKIGSETIEPNWLPLKYYLVYTSVIEKFNTSENEDDFKKIVNDSLKLIPHLFNSVLNKIHPLLTIDEKEKLILSYSKLVENKKIEDATKNFAEIFDQIHFFNHIEKGNELKNSIEIIFSNDTAQFSRRETRHHILILETVVEFLKNKNTLHFLDFADYVKNKYLLSDKITATDQLLIDEKAKELKISIGLAKIIEDSVIKTIESELILFQTLHHDKKLDTETFQQKIYTTEREIKQQNKLNKKLVIALLITLLVVISSVTYYFIPGSGFTSYEKAFFEQRYKDAYHKTKDKHPLADVKANYYYIYSTYNINDYKIPDEVRNEYRKLLKENPKSAEANYYLGLVYLTYQYWWRQEIDSSWLLINKAHELGLNNVFINISLLKLYRKFGLSSLAVEKANDMVTHYKENPMAINHSADVFLNINYDTLQAIGYYEAAAKLCPQYIDPLLNIASIQLEKNNLKSAKEKLDKAKKINNTSFNLKRYYVEYYKRAGLFNEAEKCYLNLINKEPTSNVDFYRSLAWLYLIQDSLDKGDKFLKIAFEKFPRDRALLMFTSAIAKRKRWLQNEKENAKNRKLLPWLDNFNEAKEIAKRENKPILIDFWTTWCYWCRVLEKKTYPDTAVQRKLANFVLLKINGDTEKEITKKYEVAGYPTLIIVTKDGKVLIESTYKEPIGFIKFLDDGLYEFEKIKKGETVTREKYTEVTNFEDARIIAKNKHYPVMIIVGSDKSDFSKKLVHQTIKDPAFISEFNEIVYLYLDEMNNKQLVKKWKINIFPTVLFADEKGEIIYSKYGFQPPELLADLLKDIKKSYSKNEKITDKINWLYDFDEAKSIASVERKNIFVNIIDPSCPPCKWLKENTFTSPVIVEKLNNEYICLWLEDKKDKQIISELNVNIMPHFLILNSSGKELLRKSGYYVHPDELESWLDTEDKTRILSILGDTKFREFQEQNSIAKRLIIRGCYGSAINILNKQMDLLPDYADLYLDLGRTYLDYQKPEKAIEYFLRGIKNGAKIENDIIGQIINAYLATNNKDGLINWLEKNINDFKNDKKVLGYLYLNYSELYEILQDKTKAYQYAKLSVNNNPDIFQTNLQLGSLAFLNNDFNLASKYLITANTLDKSDPNACFYLGLISEKQGNEKEMTKWFTEAKIRNSWAPWQIAKQEYEFRMNYYLYPGYLELIEQGYINALKLERDNNEIQHKLSSCLANENKNLNYALELIDMALEAEPEEGECWDTKAWVLYRLGKHVEANEAMTKAISLQSTESVDKDIQTLYHIGKIKEALKDKSARKYFEKILLIPEPNPLEKRIVEEVKKELTNSQLL